MSLRHERLANLRPYSRGGVARWPKKWPNPGDQVMGDIYGRSIGLIVSLHGEDGEPYALVLWSVQPDRKETLTLKLAKQIADELDADILADLEGLG